MPSTAGAGPSAPPRPSPPPSPASPATTRPATTTDAADHITAVHYPAAGGLPAETVNTTYDSLGRTTDLASTARTYVSNTTYDSYGLLTDRYYGTGNPSTGSVTAQRHYDYDYTDGTRQLTGITTTTTVDQVTTQQRQQDTYTYDGDGRISELREQATGQTAQSQCFAYDDQGRLSKAYTRTDTSTLPTGTSNGFLGKTEDTSTGLSLLGARAYDPHLAGACPASAASSAPTRSSPPTTRKTSPATAAEVELAGATSTIL